MARLAEDGPGLGPSELLLLLLGSASLSIGLFGSALARSQVVAAITGALILVSFLLLWLLNVTFFLSMFLAFGKRLGEQRMLGDDAASSRLATTVHPSTEPTAEHAEHRATRGPPSHRLSQAD